MGSRILGWVGHAIGFIALILLGVAAYSALTSLSPVKVPSVPRIDNERRIDLVDEQNWKYGWGIDGAEWFHHASQGTRILPRDWFVNLQQPVLDPNAPKLIEKDYLLRFGFLPSVPNETFNPDNLPIGFAIDRNFDAPYAEPPWQGPVVGLTCAACHTGQILREDSEGNLWSVRIEGGSSMINISAFQEALRLSIGLTATFSTRFDRFADGVLRDDHADPKERKQKRDALRQQLNELVEVGQEASRITTQRRLQGTPSGFGRTDALTLIGNRVFSSIGEDNLIAPEAPVNFPPLWDTPWFDWVQYNASIRMPLVRNIGEALGVGAPVNLDDRKAALFQSTVDVQNLHRMEELLGGETTFSGLQSPRWDDLVKLDLLPQIDRKLAERGSRLYENHCQRCHRPPMNQLRQFVRGESLDHETQEDLAQYFVDDVGDGRHRILLLKTVDLNEVGTDPNQALDFYGRTAIFQGQTISAALGLYAVTEAIRQAALGDLETENPELAYNRYRDFDPPENPEEVLKGVGMEQVLVANLKYRARPLNGVWATPPYLHNGSVPNLRQMLLPSDRRDQTFYLGSTRFDAENVGYETKPLRGGFLLDTRLPGNSNTGHEFRNLTLEEFETVPELWEDRFEQSPSKASQDEAIRWAIVLGLSKPEYLKLSETERLNLIRERTRLALGIERVQRDHPFRGVLGAEFTDEDRDALIEFLKSL